MTRLRVSLLSAALVTLLTAAPAAARECAVARIDGESARIWSGGAWSPLVPGPLPPGAVKIETGDGTRLEIACDDGVTVTVGVVTELNVEVLAGEPAGPADAILQLIRGIVGIVAPDPGPRRFDVRTPLAIASVRSTAWLVEHAPEAGSAVFVREGRVAVRSAARRDLLGPGEGVTVPPDGAAQPVKTWGEARIAKAAALLGLGWQ